MIKNLYTNKYNGGLFWLEKIEGKYVKLKNWYSDIFGNKRVTKKAFRRHWEFYTKQEIG